MIKIRSSLGCIKVDRKVNYPSWCCEKMQEKIEDYKYKIATLDRYAYHLEAKIAVRNELEAIINDLERILYE